MSEVCAPNQRLDSDAASGCLFQRRVVSVIDNRRGYAAHARKAFLPLNEGRVISPAPISERRRGLEPSSLRNHDLEVAAGSNQAAIAGNIDAIHQRQEIPLQISLGVGVNSRESFQHGTIVAAEDCQRVRR